MHPLFRSRSSFLAYLMVWVPLGFMLGYVLATAGHLSWTESVLLTIPLTFLLVWVCLSPWYTCKILPLGSTSAWKLTVNHLLAAMCASAVVLGGTRLFGFGLSRMFPHLEIQIRPALPILGGMLFLLYSLSVALHYVLLAVESSKQAEVLSREAELKALKSQVNPHFLFNSLNSISALTTLDAARAREMCIRLAEFLRTSLRLGEKTSIPFSEELELTRAYLDVEQVRFGSKLRIMQDAEDGCCLCEVPPLLVQPLIENAIKHGVATLTEGGEIILVARRSNQRLKVVIENPFDPDAPASRKSGFGLVNVRNRLRTRYGTGARLDIHIDQNRYRVTLTLPCVEERR